MPLGALLSNLFFSFLSLLKATLILGVLAVPVVLFGNFLRNKLKDKGLSWVSSTFLASLAIMFVASLVLYLYPAAVAPSLPEDFVIEKFSPSVWQSVGMFFVQALKIVLASVLLALIALPFVFVSSFFYSIFSDKGFGKNSSYAFSYLLTVFLVMLLGVFLFDQAVIALTYLFFFT